MEPSWAQGVTNGRPVTINSRLVPVEILEQVHEKV